ncbi:MAG: matrixin family metalloprotease [Acidobacteriota bacterium]|jgi:hypothetical protein
MNSPCRLGVSLKPPSVLIALGAAALLLLPGGAIAQEGDTESLTLMLSSNDGLRAQGMDYIIQQIDYFRQDGSRASVRLYQADFGWVPGDARRGATDGSLELLFDAPNGSADGLPASAIGNAVSRAGATWGADTCLADAPLTEVTHPGGDVTVFDGVAAEGTIGDPFAGDIVVAGFPGSVESLFGPDTIAFSVTFIFIDGAGVPTDMDADGRLDTAHNEVYLNPAMDWTLDPEQGTGFDLETTALHELGHSLGLGHFGAPPASVMNPVYAGVRRELFAIDHAALCILY